MNRNRMLRRVGCRLVLVVLAFLSASVNGANAADEEKLLGGGVQYQAAGEYSVERLNKILTS